MGSCSAWLGRGPLGRGPLSAGSFKVPQDLGGLVGYRSGAARAELLQPWPGEEQDVLLGEQVSAPERGDGTQGSHLHTLAGPTQVADQQLQHRLAVEQSTPARGGSGQGVGAGAARPFPSPPHPGKAGGRRARVRGRRTGGWGTGSSGEGSLFDEVLGLLSAQEGARPPCHGLDQAQLLLAVTQGHGLGPFRQVAGGPAGPGGAVAA